jgi:hypothetical protein
MCAKQVDKHMSPAVVNPVGSEVVKAVIVENAVFRDVALYGFNVNRRFGGTCRLHLQGRRNNASEENVRRMLTD